MVMTMEQRIELLAKARQAKKDKKLAADALKPVPIKGRPKKVKEQEGKTLDLEDKLEVNDNEIDEIIRKPDKTVNKRLPKLESEIEPERAEPEPAEAEPEIIEEVVVKKIKKPKKRIIRKIIKEQYDSESTEEEIEEVVYQAPKYKPREAKAKQVEKPPELPEPREPEVKNRGFNIFSY